MFGVFGFCTSCCSQRVERGVLSKPGPVLGKVTPSLKWEGRRRSKGGSFNLFIYIYFFFSLRAFYSLSCDSAFLMFVVYRNKHQKVAFLLDAGNSVTAQEALLQPAR